MITGAETAREMTPSWTTFSRCWRDGAGTLHEDEVTVQYADYERFEDMPSIARTEETRREWQAYHDAHDPPFAPVSYSWPGDDVRLLREISAKLDTIIALLEK